MSKVAFLRIDFGHSHTFYSFSSYHRSIVFVHMYAYVYRVLCRAWPSIIPCRAHLGHGYNIADLRRPSPSQDPVYCMGECTRVLEYSSMHIPSSPFLWCLRRSSIMRVSGCIAGLCIFKNLRIVNALDIIDHLKYKMLRSNDIGSLWPCGICALAR